MNGLHFKIFIILQYTKEILIVKHYIIQYCMHTKQNPNENEEFASLYFKSNSTLSSPTEPLSREVLVTVIISMNQEVMAVLKNGKGKVRGTYQRYV